MQLLNYVIKTGPMVFSCCKQCFFSNVWMYVLNVSDSAFFRVMVVRFKNID